MDGTRIKEIPRKNQIGVTNRERLKAIEENKGDGPKQF